MFSHLRGGAAGGVAAVLLLPAAEDGEKGEK